MDHRTPTSAAALAVAAALIASLGGVARAQTPEAPLPQARESAAGPEAPPDPTVPRGAVKEFLEDCREGRYAAAARLLDLRELAERPADGGARLAWKLKVVLDRTMRVQLSRLGDRPEGDLDDGLAPELDRVGTIRTAAGDVDVLLRRIVVDGRPSWRFAPDTVAQIPALYDEFGYGELGQVLPEVLFRVAFLDVLLWQWIGLLLLVLAAFAAAPLLVWILNRVVRPIAARTSTTLDERLLDAALRPARGLAAALLFGAGAGALRLSVGAYAVVGAVVKIVVILSFTWLLFRWADVLGERIRERLEEHGRRGAISVVPLGRRTLKVVLLGLAVLAALQNMGFHVTGILAGLGIGGLAVALAAQKSLENLFGGITLVLDQPLRVGDFGKFGDRVGTVEDIGLRSSRIRTLDRTIVTIPNAEFSQMQLENYTRRDRIWLHTTLGLRYETTPDQLRHVLAGLRRVLLSHPRIDPEPQRVRFVGFGAYSLDLEVFAYVPTRDFNEFLEVKEDLFLRFMDVVAESGTGFAFPSQTTYLGRDAGLDLDRQKKAEEEVRAWRERGELPFPGYPDEAKRAMDDSLDWPPLGSSARRGDGR